MTAYPAPAGSTPCPPPYYAATYYGPELGGKCAAVMRNPPKAEVTASGCRYTFPSSSNYQFQFDLRCHANVTIPEVNRDVEVSPDRNGLYTYYFNSRYAGVCAGKN